NPFVLCCPQHADFAFGMPDSHFHIAARGRWSGEFVLNSQGNTLAWSLLYNLPRSVQPNARKGELDAYSKNHINNGPSFGRRLHGRPPCRGTIWANRKGLAALRGRAARQRVGRTQAHGDEGAARTDGCSGQPASAGDEKHASGVSPAKSRS